METSMMFGIAALVAHLIEKLKRSNHFNWITPYSDRLTKIIAAVVAFLSAWGITAVWAVSADGHGVLTFTGIPITVNQWTDLLMHTFGQYWMSKGYYLAVIKPNRMIQEVEDKL